jgi:hypothetical protein
VRHTPTAMLQPSVSCPTVVCGPVSTQYFVTVRSLGGEREHQEVQRRRHRARTLQRCVSGRHFEGCFPERDVALWVDLLQRRWADVDETQTAVGVLLRQGLVSLLLTNQERHPTTRHQQ